MSFGELRSASGSGGRGGCSRCGRRCKQREVKALSCLCGLGFLGMLLLALPVLYLLGAKVAGKPEETLMERMPDAQKQHGEPLCKQCDSTIQPSVYARANSNVSQSKCVNGIWASSSLLWNIQSEVGDFQLDKERISLIIPKDGRYFVYSQVTSSCFRCNCEKDNCCGMNSKSRKSLLLEMWYKMSAYEQPEWTRLFTSTSPMQYSSSKSIYVGGIKLLQKGDRVMVNVSHPGLVEPDQYYTFFGAYFIS